MSRTPGCRKHIPNISKAPCRSFLFFGLENTPLRGGTSILSVGTRGKLQMSLYNESWSCHFPSHSHRSLNQQRACREATNGEFASKARPKPLIDNRIYSTTCSGVKRATLSIAGPFSRRRLATERGS